jgi:hypothetical protein
MKDPSKPDEKIQDESNEYGRGEGINALIEANKIMLMAGIKVAVGSLTRGET